MSVEPDLSTRLSALSQASAELLDVVVGFFVANRNGELRVAAWSNAAVYELKQLELEERAGPGVDSYPSGRPIVSLPLPEARRRWPTVITGPSSPCARH